NRLADRQAKSRYIFARKDNHAGLQAELAAGWHKYAREGLFNETYSAHSETYPGHGQIKTRTCQQLLIEKSWLAQQYQWNGLKSVIQVISTVHEKSTGTDSIEACWYVSSLAFNVMRKIAMACLNKMKLKK
ncbi:MAG: hypothetical protein ACRC1U_06235, partial [Vibrionaceae bacterium]